jgi:hypothetical protein
MPRPLMLVVAGPPGSGKTTYFPVTAFGVDSFNVDDRCAQIVRSYRAISPDVRRAVAQECEWFVQDHINRRLSFAVETTLRTTKAVEHGRACAEPWFLHASPVHRDGLGSRERLTCASASPERRTRCFRTQCSRDLRGEHRQPGQSDRRVSPCPRIRLHGTVDRAPARRDRAGWPARVLWRQSRMARARSVNSAYRAPGVGQPLTTGRDAVPGQGRRPVAGTGRGPPTWTPR